MAFKATVIEVHIREKGKETKHIQLWNSEGYPDTFHGGTAKIEGGKMQQVKEPKDNGQGQVYNNPVEPYTAFVNRIPEGAKKNAGKIAGISINKNRTHVGELYCSKEGEHGVWIAGTMSKDGSKMTFNKETTKLECAGGTIKIEADVKGGMAAEIKESLGRVKSRKPAEKPVEETPGM